jgi:predicted Zn-dependent protease with MMP-like domain
MIHVTDEEFGEMVEASVRDIPERFASHLANIAFRVADEPTPEQLHSGGILHGHMTLLGLYEGIPLPRRSGAGYSGVAPDMITVFKRPHEIMAADVEQLRRDVHQTVWHEVAHYFGLDHGQIRALEK